jgi:K+-transporting ATPase ATPase A chain
VVTTAVSNGSVNAMHDSLTPVSGMIPMINLMTGEVFSEESVQDYMAW